MDKHGPRRAPFRFSLGRFNCFRWAITWVLESNCMIGIGIHNDEWWRSGAFENLEGLTWDIWQHFTDHVFLLHYRAFCGIYSQIQTALAILAKSSKYFEMQMFRNWSSWGVRSWSSASLNLNMQQGSSFHSAYKIGVALSPATTKNPLFKQHHFL